MIEINLLPGSGKKKKAKAAGVDFKTTLARINERVKDKFLIGAVAAVIVAGAAGGYLYLSQASHETDLNARLDKAQKDSAHYAAMLKERYRAEATRDTLLRQVNLIRTLDADRYIWPHLMDEVSKALPQYTWVTQFGFSGAQQGTTNVVAAPKAPPVDTTNKKLKNAPPKRLDTEIPKDQVTLRITGQTVDMQAMTRFMRDLEASPFIENVLLERTELAIGAGGKEINQFYLVMNYSRPDTSLLRRVPYSLGR